MRVMGVLMGFVALFIFWPAAIAIWLFCLIPSAPKPAPDRAGDIRTFMGRRLIMGEDGQWYRLD